jgi:hypothetical protein
MVTGPANYPLNRINQSPVGNRTSRQRQNARYAAAGETFVSCALKYRLR